MISRIDHISIAVKDYEKALHFFDKVGGPLSRGNVYLKMGQVYSKTGNNARTFDMYEKALQIYMKLDDATSQGNIFLEKGKIFFDIGDNLKAIKMYEKAMGEICNFPSYLSALCLCRSFCRRQKGRKRAKDKETHQVTP